MLTFHTLILDGFFIYFFILTNEPYLQQTQSNRWPLQCWCERREHWEQAVPTSPWIKSTPAEATVVVAKYLLTSSLCFVAHVCMCILSSHTVFIREYYAQALYTWMRSMYRKRICTGCSKKWCSCLCFFIKNLHSF